MKRIAVLGSTGSIGRQTLEILEAFPDKFKIVALAAGRNSALLTRQIEQFRPHMASSSAAFEMPSGVKSASLDEIACHPEVDLVVMATSGSGGLLPTMSALKAGKTVALANKEVLVMAGEIVMAIAKKSSQLIPVDSEHSALWQCLQGETGAPAKLLVTASGGPFYSYEPERLAKVTAKDALRHPVWKMGKKITIDSATLMNKGLEVIEAHWLFNVPYERIEVLVHPQSVIHSLVQFADNSVKAQLSFPDMRLPIQYALSYPERWPNVNLPQLDLLQTKSLTFMPVDDKRFRCLALAREAGRKAGTYPAVLSAADEVAVELFLANRLGFNDIARIVEGTLNAHSGVSRPSLDDVMQADAWARDTAARLAQGVKA